MITDSLPTVVVQIRAGSRPLPEYAAPDVSDAWDSVTRYIQSTDDTFFTIRAKGVDLVADDGYELVLYIGIDGHNVGSIVLCAGNNTGTSIGRSLQEGYVKPYKFVKATTDADTDAGERNNMIGCIQITARFESSAYKKKKKQPTFPILTSLSTKHAADDNLSHVVSYGEPEAVEPFNWVEALDSKETLATYTFLYRSKSVLQSLGVLPLEKSEEHTTESTTTSKSRTKQKSRASLSEDLPAPGFQMSLPIRGRTSSADVEDTSVAQLRGRINNLKVEDDTPGPVRKSLRLANAKKGN